MMKAVRMKNGKVVEIIPDYALPVADWYGEEFASQCVDAPDEVEQGWILNPETNEFYLPALDPEPAQTATTEETIRAQNVTLSALVSLVESLRTKIEELQP